MSRTALALVLTVGLGMPAAMAAPRSVHLMNPVPNAGGGTQGNLQYCGGPVIQNVKVFTVYWGSNVTSAGTGSKGIDTFYKSVIASPYYDWLIEYNTTSPKQAIGRGTFIGSYTYTGSTSKSLQDSDVQTALSSMIDGGKVPMPDNNTYYAVHFAPGISISNNGQGSCSVFCAYHGTYSHNNQNVYYGIIPDQGGACAGGCGNDPSAFNNLTSVSSHELVEATTDPGVGLAGNSCASPLGWYDQTNGEIGDICNAQQCSGTTGKTACPNGFTVQLEWSNKNGMCMSADPSIVVNDFSVAATPTDVMVPAGGMTTVQLALTKTAGSSDTVNFTASTPPMGLTASFMPTSAMSDMGKTTLTISAAATAMIGSTGTLTVTAAGTTSQHTVDLKVTVTAPPDMAMLPDLAQPNTGNGGGNGGNGGGGNGGNGTGGNGTGGNGNNGGGNGGGGCSMSGGGIAGGWAFAGLLLLALAFRRRRA